jgi:hypothetical protein
MDILVASVDEAIDNNNNESAWGAGQAPLFAITSRRPMRAVCGAERHAWIRCVSGSGHPLRPTPPSEHSLALPPRASRPEWDDMLVFPFF